jgi:DeoR/GlpR family transcriptional regulator of sugar metabolism
MTTEQRKQKILELLKEKDMVRVTSLSKLFNVSEVTIRSYLEELEKKGFVSRVHGGAVSSYKPYYNMNLSQRLEINQKAKIEIAEKVASLINPNDTIMLNAGTTPLWVFRKFPVDYHLNIVTNSMSIALEAAGNSKYNVILVGGSVNSKYQFSYGDDAVKLLEKYHADKLILSVDGISPEQGLSTYYNQEVPIDITMMKHSDCCIIAADHSKFGHHALEKISDLSVADYIVTDMPLSNELSQFLGKKGITIL